MEKNDLATIRKRANLTQVEMAKEFGVSRRFWTYREQGAAKIPRWLYYALIGFIHEKKLLRKKKKK